MPEQLTTPAHPGVILQKEFLDPLCLSACRLSSHLYIHQQHLHDVLKGNRPITAEIALRLARFFDTSPRFWMNAQVHYDLCKCQMEMGEQIEEDVTPVVALLGGSEARA